MTKGLELDLPCGVRFEIENLVLDMNGTLSLDGEFLPGVAERLRRLSDILNVFILTADTNQTATKIQEDLGVVIRVLGPGRGDVQKLHFIEELGREKTAAIGNGYNDVLMLREAALGICIIGHEGACKEALMASDAVFRDINDALDLFLNPNRLVATFRR
ncbi:HAD family hydrolase [Thermosulfuriphilus ammonigenes]|uniref:HAD family hydrolase n=1 Tax=Thermosulfuriphilus ammonigenes TaxID=1936021 RepID=A0A6G7PV74_9BACT|nr:HAD family hydrolase [Thermosulfuriphilus ammonigenes]MBA2848424.1 P-type E1-E2 ATPase [Thermosulfuriphilus ammonigenes]QIJ71421.1 HAD family hydrolase [Thermosulfuriphilus ammonigenes]HFB83989.1 HAD family hydrolase [Thermodesulfatator sp.]